jgi:hypothetical protein
MFGAEDGIVLAFFKNDGSFLVTAVVNLVNNDGFFVTFCELLRSLTQKLA